MINKIKKRFIAGASCQHCGQTDCLQLLIEDEKETVICVECGHSMKKPQAPESNEPGEIIAQFKSL